MLRIFYRTCLYMVTLITPGLAIPAPATAVAVDEHPATVAEKMLAGIHQATWVQEGKGPHVVYIFFDPDCPYCHQIYVDTRDWIKRDAMEFRWIPVGVLTVTSPGKAAAILAAKDPLKAFYQNEEHFARGEGGGGIDEALVMEDKTKKALDMNASLLRLSGFDAVPTLLFRADNGEAVVIRGAPPGDKLKQILGYVK
ncbi:MAG TPA: thioredoxin [Gammaproteobacteria bacterium]|nr:thioredoxin [Gammaproteobacteria bacterium]